jgi:hypothetical protein
MKALEDKYSAMLSLEEIQKMKIIIDSQNYVGKNQVLMEMIEG